MRFWFLGFFSSSNLSLCFLVSFQMFSTSSSDFRSLHHGHRGNKGEGGGGFRGHRQGQVGCGERVEGVEGCGDEGGLVDRDEGRWWGVNDWSCGASVVAVINGLLRHRGHTGEDGPDKNQILHNDGYVPSRAETVSH